MTQMQAKQMPGPPLNNGVGTAAPSYIGVLETLSKQYDELTVRAEQVAIALQGNIDRHIGADSVVEAAGDTPAGCVPVEYLAHLHNRLGIAIAEIERQTERL